MSMQRRCDFYKASDDNWYLILGDFEHAEEDEDCSFFGPFNSMEEADEFLRQSSFPNPGGAEIDDSGIEPPPDASTLERIR